MDDVYREYNIAPPALTIAGARTIMKRLCNGSGITIDGDYLKPHGARRGIGDEIYRKDRGLAQDFLRHRSLSTTKEAYSHIEAEERGQLVRDLLDYSNTNG